MDLPIVAKRTTIMKERKSVYGLPVDDTTLEWYSKAVTEMKTRPTDDPTSWAYQGAIHGLSRNPDTNQYWRQYRPFPTSGVTPFWKQCQHQTWYFIPWHRMYLAYFEQIVAQTIVDLGGPAGWSLPFWNYSDTANPDALNIPPAFTSPANATNPLWMPNRRDSVQRSTVSLVALEIPIFTTTGTTNGYGGRVTRFNHGGGQSGGLENLPHNHIHMDIGGAMGDPNTAALDPIFWLHHSNIDRLWQVWLNQGRRTNPTSPNWLNLDFNFHDKDKNPVTMNSSQVLDTRTVLSGYTYEGVPSEVPARSSEEIMENADLATMPLEVVGATDSGHKLDGKNSKVSLQLASSGSSRKNLTRKVVSEGLTQSTKKMLHFENIKGKGVAPIHSIYINTPDGNGQVQSHLAGTIAFFGLEGASVADEHHSGSGLTEIVEVTKLIEELQSQPNWDESKLDVEIRPDREMDEGVEVSVGKISLYSE